MPDKLTLKQMRILKGDSQEVVVMTSGVAISREHLGRLESDFSVLRSAKIDTILGLVSFYGYSVSDLVFFE